MYIPYAQFATLEFPLFSLFNLLFVFFSAIVTISIIIDVVVNVCCCTMRATIAAASKAAAAAAACLLLLLLRLQQRRRRQRHHDTTTTKTETETEANRRLSFQVSSWTGGHPRVQRVERKKQRDREKDTKREREREREKTERGKERARRNLLRLSSALPPFLPSLSLCPLFTLYFTVSLAVVNMPRELLTFPCWMGGGCWWRRRGEYSYCWCP